MLPWFKMSDLIKNAVTVEEPLSRENRMFAVLAAKYCGGNKLVYLYNVGGNATDIKYHVCCS